MRRFTGGGWLGADDEESRAFLQDRLISLSKLMFWAFVSLLASISLLYWEYPRIEPAREQLVQEMAAGGLIALAIVWRLVLARRPLAIRSLYAIDAFYALGTGCCFGFAAYVARDFRPSPYSCLLYACFMILLRAIVVPSTGARTAINGVVTSVPMTVAAAAIAVVSADRDVDLPGTAYVIAAIAVSAIVILFATIGSRTIYGLRRQVTEAMQLGQYTLDRKIGEGGMGAVYRARHALLRRPTAIKILRPENAGGSATIDRFEREVQHMSQLTHPNTVAVFDYGRNHDGVFYYVMEYLDGIDLERLVERHGPQPADRVVAILLQVCGALQEAHRVGIVHRDIKPANIILCDRGGVPDIAKVVDFGLVKEIAADSSTSTQVILGTPAYIAPEAVLDPSVVGPAVDVYSLGAVGYFLLTGKRVFEGKTAVAVCMQHVTAAPRPLSEVAAIHIPAEVERVILKCLAKAPDARPSATDLARHLHALPPANDWTEDEALRWWTEFHRAAEVSAAMSATITITVDLGQRREESGDGVRAATLAP